MDSRETTAQRSALDALIDEAVDLQTLPIIVLEADRLIRSPTTNAQNLADLLSRDPPLAGRILKLSNSAYYGFRRRLGNLTQAIVVLGFQTVRNLMLTACIIEKFSKGNRAFDYTSFWVHSLASAIAAQEVGRALQFKNVEFLYASGLLHDIGRLLVVQRLPEMWERMAAARVQLGDELAAERIVFGADHTDIGARLVRSWGMPDGVVDAIRDHHLPAQEDCPVRAADIVHLGEVLANSLLPMAAHDTPAAPSAGSSRRFGYDAEILAGWLCQIENKLARAQEFFDLLGLGGHRFGTFLADTAVDHERQH